MIGGVREWDISVISLLQRRFIFNIANAQVVYGPGMKCPNGTLPYLAFMVKDHSVFYELYCYTIYTLTDSGQEKVAEHHKKHYILWYTSFRYSCFQQHGSQEPLVVRPVFALLLSQVSGAG